MVCLESKHSNTFAVVVQLPSHIWLFATPWTATHQASLSLTMSCSLPKFMFIASVMHPAILFSDALFSFCPQSFPVSGTLPVSHLCASDDQNTSASASVLPVNIQGWSPFRWLVWFPCCWRDFQESSPASQFKGINSLAFCLLCGPALTTICDHWEDHSLDDMDLCLAE